MMGCDIHGYIEYEAFKTKEGEPYYSTFAQHIGDRDYAMFGILAGVRRDGCIYPTRGLPENVNAVIKWEFCLWVSEDGDSEGFTSRENAEKWVRDGSSKWVGEDAITHPDWHSASWLNSEEFENCLNKRKEINNYGSVNPIWDAALAAMKQLPEARFVFWFDN